MGGVLKFSAKFYSLRSKVLEIMALPKKQRLEKKLIREILQKGRTVHNNNISLKYLIKSDRQKAFAFIVSAKTVKKAVNRNLLKRRGRAIVFKLLPRIEKGLLALIFFKKGSKELSFCSLEAEITQTFQKTGLLI